ncbi:MAG TPA: hypothetical protein VMX13_00565 [Sedimentisphaerales bacterium]|nr:hypothetical protein [Sedimentisphaerales bacterium]
MSTREKSVSLRWLILVVVTIAVSLVAWFRYRTGRIDPRTRQYTTQQWLQMVKQTEHQPQVRWQGIGCGTLDRNSAGLDGPTLSFDGSPAGILEYQLSGLLKRDPMMFLPLFDSQHPQEILTAVSIYLERDPERKLHCTAEQKYQLAQAFRKLIDYKNDSRIRFAGILYLGWRELLTVEDVKKGMSDERLDVRFTTARQMHRLYRDKVSYSEDDKLLKGDPNTVRHLIEVKRALAPILLDHVNEPHFFLRSFCAQMFGDLLKRPVRREKGGTRYDLVPGGLDEFDWMRESWQAREDKKKEWKKWWAEHGEEALRWTHPSN